MTAIPEIASQRELHVRGGDWRNVCGISMGTISALFANVDHAYSAALDRATDKSESLTVLVGEPITSLWLAETRLAIVGTKP